MGVYSTKQYIIIRKDLKMPKGKIAAQACHASVGALKHYKNIARKPTNLFVGVLVRGYYGDS